MHFYISILGSARQIFCSRSTATTVIRPYLFSNLPLNRAQFELTAKNAKQEIFSIFLDITILLAIRKI